MQDIDTSNTNNKETKDPNDGLTNGQLHSANLDSSKQDDVAGPLDPDYDW